MFNRRRFALAAVLGAAWPALAQAQGRALTVYKTSSCTCCEGWVKAMARAGYAPKVVTLADISPVWRKHGVPDALSSCHMATIAGYVTVGHVPPADVDRLLKTRPRAIGLTVPGMPLGSPGMESPSGKRESYQTLLLLPGGRTTVFARHAGNI